MLLEIIVNELLINMISFRKNKETNAVVHVSLALARGGLPIGIYFVFV